MVAEADPWSGIEVKEWGRYLGYAVGPGRHQHSWDRPRAKFCERLRDWPWAKLGLHLAVRVFNVFLLPTLLFVAQLEDPPPEVLGLVLAAGERVAPGPYRWISYSDLRNLRLLAGFPVELKDIGDAALATQARVAAWEAHDCGGLLVDRRRRRLEEMVRDTPHEERAWRWRSWYGSSHAHVLVEAKRRLAGMGVTQRGVEVRLAGGEPRPWAAATMLRVRRGYQRAVSRSLPRLHELDVEARVRHKLARWHLPGLPPRVARLVLRRLRALRGRVQPRAQAAVLRVLWNGVVTARRFQQDADARGCQLGCCPPRGADSLEHYAGCPRLRAVARASLGVDLEAADFRLSFFFAAPARDNEAELRTRWARMALLHYALHRTLCAARHHPHWCPRDMAVPALRQALREGVSPDASARPGQG